MTIIPKGETHGWAFAKFGEEDGDRLVVSEDLVVIPKKDYDKAKEILSEMRLGPPPGDETPASLACLTFADRIDKALSGDEADGPIGPIDGMTFGMAIEALKLGKKVTRRGWNGKGMFLWLKPAANIKAEWCKDEMLKGLVEANGGEIIGLGTICMYTHDATGRKAILTGWLASQSDMLSKDWVVVE